MNTKKIDYFLKVCETKNITEAAEALYVSRSVVSRALLDLEKEYGTVLFERSKTGVELTEGGKIVYNHLITTPQITSMRWTSWLF